MNDMTDAKDVELLSDDALERIAGADFWSDLVSSIFAPKPSPWRPFPPVVNPGANDDIWRVK